MLNAAHRESAAQTLELYHILIGIASDFTDVYTLFTIAVSPLPFVVPLERGFR
jgi:3-isopropylmalate dehydratase small subunit